MKFISMRCSNVNCPDPDEQQVQPKKNKLESMTAQHSYPQIPSCDDVSYERNMRRMTKELEKTKQNHDILVDLRTQTFPNRWKCVINEQHPVSSVCDKFLLLKSPGHVSSLY